MKNRIIPITLAFVFISTQFLIAQKDHMMREKSTIKRAIAVLTATKGNSVCGVVTFEEGDKGIRVVATLTSLNRGSMDFIFTSSATSVPTTGTQPAGTSTRRECLIACQ